jgi:signal transduction histidine kinase
MLLVVIVLVLLVLFRARWRVLQATRHPGAVDVVDRCPGASWHDAWHRAWAEKFERHAQHLLAHHVPSGRVDRAAVGFEIHLLAYLGTMAMLGVINLMTTSYPWCVWPMLGWGIGLFVHYLAVFSRQVVQRRWVRPEVARELRREKAVMTTEKQASIDELSSTLAHEIRNPIAAAKSLVQQMAEDPTALQNVEYAQVALEELDRVERHVSHLLKYAREEDYALAPVDVAKVVDAALTALRAKLDAAHVTVARNYIGGPTIVADAEKLRRVFTNIVDNAVDALADQPGERRIDCWVGNGDGRATVRVRDNGPGIPPEKLERVFNPFFTTKASGTGLGMAIAKKIVEAHEGSIDATSEPGRGAEFVVVLPLPQ